MDKTQAGAVSEAILEPHLRAQDARTEEVRAKRAAADALHARKRIAAGFALAGTPIGAAISYFTGASIAQGIVWGGLTGAALAMLVVRPRRA